MILKRDYKNEIQDTFYSVAIGNFDGIHLGHRFILKHLKSYKNSSKDKIAVITFHPHPIKVLKSIASISSSVDGRTCCYYSP